MMTRNNAVLALAKNTAVRDGYVWQLHPNWGQTNKQNHYIREAERSISFIEKSMKDFAWKPEETENEKA